MAEGVHIVDRAEHWSDDDFVLAQSITKNAIRLLEDAALLNTYSRWGTSFTLSTIAFEELGKVALLHWKDDSAINALAKHRSFHIRKQAAAACLLMADVAKKAIDLHPNRSGLSTLEHGDAEHEADLLNHIAAAIAGSRPKRLLELITLQAVERVKHLGLYVDESSLEHGMKVEQFSRMESDRAMGEARSAVSILLSPVHLQIGRAIYKTDPLKSYLGKYAKRDN
jgi:AbiV family abortive infection protein